MKNKRLHSGFTLIEMMVAVAVISISVAVSGSLADSFVSGNRQSALVNDFVAALQMARSESVKRGATVSLCPSVSGTSCDDVAWGEGWIMFVNDDSDSPVEVDEGEELLRAVTYGGGALDFYGSGALSGGVSFFSRGLASSAGEFVVCDSNGAKRARAVLLNIGGRVRLSDAHADGSEISCG